MVRLSVNLNKVALVRNSRGANFPDLIQTAKDCERFGAQGITVHPRPDERHVRYLDLEPLKRCVSTEFNIEGYPSERFLEQVCLIKPTQCTLVPDPPDALTSDTGWNTVKEQSFLQEVISRLQEQGIRVSLFLDPVPHLVEGAKLSGADRIELYTGKFAKAFSEDRRKAVKPHSETALVAQDADLGVNAGHDLNLQNLRFYAEQVEGLQEVSIGHALICDAMYHGFESTIKMYREQLS